MNPEKKAHFPPIFIASTSNLNNLFLFHRHLNKGSIVGQQTGLIQFQIYPANVKSYLILGCKFGCQGKPKREATVPVNSSIYTQCVLLHGYLGKR